MIYEAGPSSGDVVVTPSVSRQRAALAGGKSAAMMQLIRGMWTLGSGSWVDIDNILIV